MAMWNDYEKIARRLDRIANAFERIANALETANIIEADRKTEPIDKDINVRSKTEPQTEKPKIRKRIDKPFRAVWLDDDHNEIGTPQTDCSWQKGE